MMSVEQGADALKRLGESLKRRFPDRVVKRFVMPKSIRTIREVFIVECTSKDEILAAQMADQMMSAAERGSFKLTQEAERRYMVALSVVAVGRGAGGETVEYEETNLDGIPWVEMGNWPMRVTTAVHTYFSYVNGVPNAEIAEGIEGAQTVGAFALPPIGETPPSADTGRSAANSGANTSG